MKNLTLIILSLTISFLAQASNLSDYEDTGITYRNYDQHIFAGAAELKSHMDTVRTIKNFSEVELDEMNFSEILEMPLKEQLISLRDTLKVGQSFYLRVKRDVKQTIETRIEDNENVLRRSTSVLGSLYHFAAEVISIGTVENASTVIKRAEDDLERLKAGNVYYGYVITDIKVSIVADSMGNKYFKDSRGRRVSINTLALDMSKSYLFYAGSGLKRYNLVESRIISISKDAK